MGFIASNISEHLNFLSVTLVSLWLKEGLDEVFIFSVALECNQLIQYFIAFIERDPAQLINTLHRYRKLILLRNIRIAESDFFGMVIVYIE
jgi:hypothetical protein